MAYRVDKIVQKVLRGLGDEAQHGITRDVILNEMDAVQLELCRDYYAIKDTLTIALAPGAGTLSPPAGTLTLVPFADVSLNVPAGTSKVYFANGLYASNRYFITVIATAVSGGLAGYDSITKDADGFTINNLSDIANIDYSVTPYTDNLLTNNTAAYVTPSTTYKIKEIIEPDTWRSRLEVINDSNVFARLSRRNIVSSQPLWAYFWNNEMLLTPVPTIAETLTVLVYCIPSLELADGNDPETPLEYDDCLEWETLYRFNGQERLHQRYVEKALQNGIQNSKEAVAGVNRVESSTDLLGY